MIKITFKDKPGVIWFPVNGDQFINFKPGSLLHFILNNTIHNIIDKQIQMNLSNVGSNYIVVTYNEDTFKNLPDGEYIISTGWQGRNLKEVQWLLHIGPYYTESPLQNVKVIKNNNKEIKSFV